MWLVGFVLSCTCRWAEPVGCAYDYLLRFAVKDTQDHERLLRERLYKKIKGIRHSKSSFVRRALKKDDLPLLRGWAWLFYEYVTQLACSGASRCGSVL